MATTNNELELHIRSVNSSCAVLGIAVAS